MPKILLINPCYNKKETLGPFSKYITAQIPLSIGFLAGYLLREEIDVEIIDEQIKQTSEEQIKSILKDNDICAVGITVLTLTANRAYELGAMVKRVSPITKVIMGGIHASLLPEESLESNLADIVVKGEGELTLHELLEKILENQPLQDVPGIVFREKDQIIHNPHRDLIENLDTLPMFPYHLFEKNIQSYQFGNMLASRGCPYQCLYCSQLKIHERRYRTRSPKNIVDELAVLVNKYHQDFVFFNDDNFIVNKPHVHELCERIIEQKFPKNLKLGINARGDSVDSKLLARMREAHFTTILFGLESGSERILKLVQKGETVAQIEAGVRMAKDAGFIVGGQFILGFPTETRQESLMTIHHALEIPVDFTRFNLLVPYPGSGIYEILNKEKGRIIKDQNWSNYASHSGLTGKHIPYIPEGRSEQELLRLQWWGNLVFFMRLKQILNIRNLRYAMANQIVLPNPRTFRGFFELIAFLLYIIFIFFKKWIVNLISFKRTNNA